MISCLIMFQQRKNDLVTKDMQKAKALSATFTSGLHKSQVPETCEKVLGLG